MSEKKRLKEKDIPIIIEKVGESYSAYSPSLLGCVATGKSEAEVRKNMAVAIRMHLEG